MHVPKFKATEILRDLALDFRRDGKGKILTGFNSPRCELAYLGAKAAGSSGVHESTSPRGSKRISSRTCYPRKTKSYKTTTNSLFHVAWQPTRQYWSCKNNLVARNGHVWIWDAPEF